MPDIDRAKAQQAGEMNAASLWRLAVARRVAASYASNPGVAAIIAGGSTGRGHADRFSDIEVGVFWHRPPTDEERRAAADGTGGYVHRIYPYEPEEDAWSDDIFVGHLAPDQPTTGVLVEVVHYTMEYIEHVLTDVLERYDPSEQKQNLVSAIVSSIPVCREDIVKAWRSRAAVYPRELALAVVKRYAQIDHFWRYEMFLERGDNLVLLYDSFAQVSRRLFHLLLALNRIYYAGFKWIHLQIAGMQVTPVDFERRLKQVFKSEPRAAAQELESLVEETYSLVEQAMPEIDVQRLRSIFRYKRQPWDRPPEGLMQEMQMAILIE